MKIIGCDFHPSYQQIAMLDLVTGEMVEKALSQREKGGGAGLLCGTGRARTSGDRSQRAIAMVRADADGVGARGVDWGCGEDSRQLRAQAEDRPGRCGVAAEASGGGSFSADLGAHGGRARRGAVALASSQAGAHAHAGEEPVAGAGAESGSATEVEAVEQGGKRAAGVAAAAALGQPAQSGVVAAVRSTGSVDRRIGPRGG